MAESAHSRSKTVTQEKRAVIGMGTIMSDNAGQQDSHTVGAVLVVGGGISGMQSALDLANSGFKVYLVEENTSIGGRMSQLDKTFPTNDCSMCMISPKLIEVDRGFVIGVHRRRHAIG